MRQVVNGPTGDYGRRDLSDEILPDATSGAPDHISEEIGKFR